MATNIIRPGKPSKPTYMTTSYLVFEMYRRSINSFVYHMAGPAASVQRNATQNLVVNCCASGWTDVLSNGGNVGRIVRTTSAAPREMGYSDLGARAGCKNNEHNR